MTRDVGRYRLHAELAAGGMATVHLGRLQGEAGFALTVAIKRLHPNYACDPEFVSMFVDEARLAARIRHPNVVPVFDVAIDRGELFLVMDYVHGESLAKLLKMWGGRPLAPGIAARIATDVLSGLDAAHDARGYQGDPLEIVHRDVSPQNVLVGVDGVSRVVDFGVAKASNRIQTTQEGQLKGKMWYVAPEQLREGKVDRRTDVYAASVVLWEMLTGRRLFATSDPMATIARILRGDVEPPSSIVSSLSPRLDRLVVQGLSLNPDERFPTAQAMAVAIARAVSLEPSPEVGSWVRTVARESLARRALLVAELEAQGTALLTPDQGASVAAQLADEVKRSIPPIPEGVAPRASTLSDLTEPDTVSSRTEKSAVVLGSPRPASPEPKSAGRFMVVGSLVLAAVAVALSLYTRLHVQADSPAVAGTSAGLPPVREAAPASAAAPPASVSSSGLAPTAADAGSPAVEAEDAGATSAAAADAGLDARSDGGAKPRPKKWSWPAQPKTRKKPVPWSPTKL